MARQSVSNTFRVYYVSCDLTGMGYVGITGWTIERRFQRHLWNAARKRPGMLYDAIREYGAAAFSIHFMEAATSWEDAQEHERRLIIECGTKMPLGYNMTGGGDGNYGYEYTDEARARMRASKAGVKLSEEHRKKIGEANSRRSYDPVAAAKISAARLGKKASEETCAKMAIVHALIYPTAAVATNIGSKRTPEQRARMSAGMIGVKRSAESCENIAAAAVLRNARWIAEGRPAKPPLFTGKTHTDETRAKMSATNKARWAARKGHV